MFDISQFKEKVQKTSRYERRINQLQNKGMQTKCIENAVNDSISNIKNNCAKSFVIYGEPQSGKTEMMIALSAKLLDTGHRIIVVLLNDNVQLLNQNLKRFKESGIDPSPKNFSEILDHSVYIGDKEWIIFCKKNINDLKKLINKLDGNKKITIIDDEADYASPNGKVNKEEKTRINEQIEVLIGEDGYYIGVTATPARLNLNNTFNNENLNWVNFPPHDYYTGQDIFFPIPENSDVGIEHKYNLNLIPDEGDDPKYLRNALFSFLVNVAHLNLEVNNATGEKNYSFLVHTSGKKVDHTQDYKELQKIINYLTDLSSSKFDKYIKSIWDISKERFPGSEDEITKYIVDNINRNDLIVMNSDNEKKNSDMSNATVPATLLTIIIGGNIVSRALLLKIYYQCFSLEM
jgi:hypothetical protein